MNFIVYALSNLMLFAEHGELVVRYRWVHFEELSGARGEQLIECGQSSVDQLQLVENVRRVGWH